VVGRKKNLISIGNKGMTINNLQKDIDKAVEDFDTILEDNNFGNWNDPVPLNPKDDVEVEQSEEETKPLDFNI
tara:strand:+ start:2799 stop:3017 length:219 start_codon:yes stop_codon:yes gene_type:complete